MTHSRGHLFSTHRRTLAALLFGLSFSIIVAYATPPGSAYTPGETLDPTCAPGDTFCTVAIAGGLTFSTGLTNTANTITNNLSTGVSGGQSVVGGTAASNNLTLSSTTNATKGKIIFGTSVYDEANNRLGIGTTSPDQRFVVQGQTVGGTPTYLRFDSGILSLEGDLSAQNGVPLIDFKDTATNQVFSRVGYILNTGISISNSWIGLNKSAVFIEHTADENSFVISRGTAAYGVPTRIGIGTATPSSRFDVTTDALSETQTAVSGIALVNHSPAVNGVQQISPAIRWSGHGWKTASTAASQAVDFRAYVTPVQGTTNPTGYLGFGSSINGGAYTDNQLVLTSQGYVGIGTTTPSNVLEVTGGASIFNGDIRIRSGNTFVVLNADNSLNGSMSLIHEPNNPAISIVASQYNGSTIQGYNGEGSYYYATVSGNRIVSIDRNVLSGGTTGGNGFTIGDYAEYAPTTGTNTYNTINLNPIINATGGTNTVRGIYYNPNLTAVVGTTNIAFENTTGNVLLGTTSGRVGIANTNPGYLLHVGSSAVTTGTTVARFENQGGTCDVVPSTIGGITCTSDERLKKNITTLDDSILDKILSLRLVTYNLRAEENTDPLHTGVIAQELVNVFPELVATDSSGWESVSYTGLIPYTIKAIQEMNLRVTELNDMQKANPLRDNLTAWFANAANHITRIFTGEICLTDTDGTSECLNKAELGQLKQLLNTQTRTPDPVVPSTPDPLPSQDPSIPELVPESTPAEIPTDTSQS